MLARGAQVRGVGCYAQPVIRKMRFPGLGAADGAVVPVASESDQGYSGVFSGTGTVLTVTGPKAKKAFFVSGMQIVSAAATGTLTYNLVPTAWSPTTGTYTFSAQDNTGTVEAPPTTCTLDLVICVDEGSS